jgi:hypothetical protein
MMNSKNHQPYIRLHDFKQNPETVFASLQGQGAKGDLISRATHEGIEVLGSIPKHLLPPFHLDLHHQDDENNTNNSVDKVEKKYYENDDDDEELIAKYSQDQNIFLQSQKRHKTDFLLSQQLQKLQEGENNKNSQATTTTTSNFNNSNNDNEPPPPKTLGWLHATIENFFVFRTKQFEIKQGNTLHYALSDDADKASRMIVSAPITDDVAFHVFEMVSERYGVPNVVAQQCDVILRTAKYFSNRDVSACLLFALLKTPNFDSNDVRFVVEAKKAMRSSVVSQRGVDGVLRWFIPLRVVPHVIRKACEHPWARPVLAKTHSAFEKLFSDQRRTTSNLFLGSSSSSSIAQPLFTLPSPSRLNLIPPFEADHPLIGRGPYVDIRGNEQFLGSQPPQLVIGADYLLCMLFCNWLDQRENVLSDVAEGKPIRTIVNRRQGRVADGKTLTDQDSRTVNRLQLFALDLDDETGDFVEGLLQSARKNHQQESPEDKEKNVKDPLAPLGKEGEAVKTTTTTTMADLAALAEKNNTGGNTNIKKDQQQQYYYSRNPMMNNVPPPRVLHLYTKQ